MIKEFFQEHGRDIGKGAFGMLASGGGTYVSFLPQIEAWLRIVSLLVGIAVGVATFISIVRKWRAK